MTINKFLIAPAIGAAGHWWEALFNLLLAAALLYHMYIYLPYQVVLANRIRGGLYGVLFWIASVSFMSINVGFNSANENRQLDYIIIAGIFYSPSS